MSTTRNLAVVVAWHGGSPKVSTSCIEPKGNTFSPENPRKWVLTGSSLSLPMPILSKIEAKMMSAELRCQLGPDGQFCWPQLLELPKSRHGGTRIPLDLSQRMLWMCRAKAVWTPLVLPLLLLT